MSTTPHHAPLDLANDPVCHGLVVEASAGTGKTYSVAAVVTRELALRDDLRIGQVLITTFTRNAAAELRDRVRRRLVDTAAILRLGTDAAGDVIVERLRDGTVSDVASRASRLEQAVAEFDTATISTIHGVCSRVLKTAGFDAGSVVESGVTERIIAEVVNDVVVSHSTATHRWDEKRIVPLVTAMLADPFLEAWIDRDSESLSPADQSRLAVLHELLQECVRRVQAATTSQPGYHDLLRIAYALVTDEKRIDLLLALLQRFKLAIVDEAQDTDRLQWAFFRRLFPGGDGRALISVGDPKQAIYGFRGADVRAYVAYAEQATTHRTLTTNRRSDQPLLDVLNASFSGQTFGHGIAYLEVNAPASRQTSQLKGVPNCVEFIELGETSSQQSLTKPVLGKVVELLDDAKLVEAKLTLPSAVGSAKSKTRRVEPKDICVLVRSGNVGRLVQRELSRAGIPAVTGGTSSVMTSSMAVEIQSLLDALEQPSNTGRVRRAAATVFFGHSLADVGALTDEVLGDVQDRLFALVGVLSSKGVGTLAATLEADIDTMQRIASGRQGERNITDFLHIFEALDSASPRRGCTPEQALKLFSRLAAMDDSHELVSRRVESDADAVKILTIHAAKGLQFPCVIVADLWKTAARGGSVSPIVFYDAQGVRRLDLGFAIGQASAHAKARRQAADEEESRRLLYVAATRAEHSLTLLVARGSATKNGPAPESVLEQTMPVPEGISLVPPSRRTERTRPARPTKQEPLDIAAAPLVKRTFRRMSFTSMTAASGRGSLFAPEGAGHDEPVAAEESLNADLLPSSSSSSELADLPAGVTIGSVFHALFERIDTSHQPLREEVERVVDEQVTSRGLRHWKDPLIQITCNALETPLGCELGDLTLGSIPPADRLSEMEFSFGMASLTDGVCVSEIGRLLQASLAAEDPLRPYAELLTASMELPVGGLLTGSIDAVVRLPTSTAAAPRLLVCDYKSNKLHRSGMSDPVQAYAADRLPAAMAEHHYPLQALLYGTALFRMLRWRLPDADPDDCIEGVVYAFIRGMLGPTTPVDRLGRRHGVFFWKPPRGLWQQLSDLLAHAPTAGGPR